MCGKIDVRENSSLTLGDQAYEIECRANEKLVQLQGDKVKISQNNKYNLGDDKHPILTIADVQAWGYDYKTPSKFIFNSTCQI